MEAGRGHWFSGTGVIDGCELSHIYWELSPGPLQEQKMLLATDQAISPAPRYNALNSMYNNFYYSDTYNLLI